MLKEYISVKEILDMGIEEYSNRYRLEEKIRNDRWIFRSSRAITKPVREYHISNFPREVREKIVNKLLEKYKNSNSRSNLEISNKSIEIAYAKFEIIQYIKNNNLTKQEFINVYNSKKANLNTYSLIDKISKIMLYRWMKNYNEYGIDGLRNRSNERKCGKVKNTLIKDTVEGLLLDKPHIKASLITEVIKKEAKRQNIEVPSYRSIIRYCENFKQKNKATFLLAKNPDAYRSKFGLALGNASEEAIEPNYLWELDSTPADVMTKDGRVTIIGCIDVYTRRVKFYVQKTSNSLGITALLRQCIISWGIPKIIKTDNGKDYTSQQIKVVTDKLGIQHRLCTPFQGWEKPHIERVFGTLQHGLLEAHKDYIGHNVATRKALEAVKSFAKRMFEQENKVSITVEQLQRYLVLWSEEYYFIREHKGLKEYVKRYELNIKPTPKEMLNYAVNEGFKEKFPNSIRDLDLLLEPLAGIRTIGKKGIRVDHANYFEPTLAMNMGEQVYVRVDRFDMGKVYIFDKSHQFLVEAINYELLGKDKQEFIAKSKNIQKRVMKEAKEKTRRFTSKAKKLQGLIEINLEHVEAKIYRENKSKQALKEDKVEQKEEQSLENLAKKEADKRFTQAKELESKLEKGETLTKIAKNDLEAYQQTREYVERNTIYKLNQDLLNKQKIKEKNTNAKK